MGDLDPFHDHDGHPTDLDPTAVVYTYDYACNWWVSHNGRIITQEEMTARMARPHPRAPLAGTLVVEE